MQSGIIRNNNGMALRAFSATRCLPPVLFCFYLLFHVNELAFAVVEFILQESQFL